MSSVQQNTTEITSEEAEEAGMSITDILKQTGKPVKWTLFGFKMAGTCLKCIAFFLLICAVMLFWYASTVDQSGWSFPLALFFACLSCITSGLSCFGLAKLSFMKSMVHRLDRSMDRGFHVAGALEGAKNGDGNSRAALSEIAMGEVRHMVGPRASYLLDAIGLSGSKKAEGGRGSGEPNLAIQDTETGSGIRASSMTEKLFGGIGGALMGALATSVATGGAQQQHQQQNGGSLMPSNLANAALSKVNAMADNLTHEIAQETNQVSQAIAGAAISRINQVTGAVGNEINQTAQASQNVVRHGFANVLKMTEAVGIDSANIAKVEQAIDKVKRPQHMLDEESKEEVGGMSR